MSGLEGKLPAPDKGFSEEQLRIWKQVDIIQRDLDMIPLGQPYKRSPDGVNAHTGERILYADLDRRKSDVLYDENGTVISIDEYRMQQQGWGRPIMPAEGKKGAWRVNANLGIRTHGEDALNIVLVETKGEDWGREILPSGRTHIKGESRLWEYHINRKGQDASKPENVLRIPVLSMCGAGLLADIGNEGSSYTSQGLTTKSFQPQKVQRNADNIDIIVPPAAGMGVSLFILPRPSLKAFAGKTAYKGGRIILPAGSIDKIRGGYNSTYLQLKGSGNNWGNVVFASGLTTHEILENQANAKGSLYEVDPLPQDETIIIEGKNGKPNEMLSYPARDGGGVIPPGCEVKISGNTGIGANIQIQDKKPIQGPKQSDVTKDAWSLLPIWVHGPGNKGSIDMSGLDGNIVIGGGGSILTSRKTKTGTWWYANVILTGGNAKEKAIYTLEVPQFEDPKLHLDLLSNKNPREYNLTRYPMLPYKQIPLKYPDGKPVSISQTENDTITISGDHIEVRVKEGDKIRTLYDSDKPELNQQSGILHKNGVMVGGAILALASHDLADKMPTRRQFLGASAAALAGGFTAAFASRQDDPFGKSTFDLNLRKTPLESLDTATAPIRELFPDIRMLGNGQIVLQDQPLKHLPAQGDARRALG